MSQVLGLMTGLNTSGKVVQLSDFQCRIFAQLVYSVLLPIKYPLSFELYRVWQVTLIANQSTNQSTNQCFVRSKFDKFDLNFDLNQQSIKLLQTPLQHTLIETYHGPCPACYVMFLVIPDSTLNLKFGNPWLQIFHVSYLVIMSTPLGGGYIIFAFFAVRCPMSDVRCPLSDVRCPMSGVRRPMSGVTHGFRSFKGKVLELLSPNLVCRLIGSVACLGLLLAVVPLLLTE